MAIYIIEKGPDSRIAIDSTGFAKQDVDISVVLELSNLPKSRLVHLTNLYTQMMSIPINELPKIIEIQD
jgi:hypothetical protein